MLAKPNPSAIIARGMTHAFIDELRKIKLTKIIGKNVLIFQGLFPLLQWIRLKKRVLVKNSHVKVSICGIARIKNYSIIFFEYLLQDLYEMSTRVLGFQMILLRANEQGEKLYTRKKFINASQYLIPFDYDDKYGKCIPMCLQISDNLYNIGGIL